MAHDARFGPARAETANTEHANTAQIAQFIFPIVMMPSTNALKR